MVIDGKQVVRPASSSDFKLVSVVLRSDDRVVLHDAARRTTSEAKTVCWNVFRREDSSSWAEGS